MRLHGLAKFGRVEFVVLLRHYNVEIGARAGGFGGKGPFRQFAVFKGPVSAGAPHDRWIFAGIARIFQGNVGSRPFVNATGDLISVAVCGNGDDMDCLLRSMSEASRVGSVKPVKAKRAPRGSDEKARLVDDGSLLVGLTPQF